MANFSVNQVNQMYVANNGYTSNGTAKGQITKVVKTPENQLYFLFNGADTVLKSDYIPISTITYAKAIDAADMADKMRKVYVTLDSNVNSGNPVSGQDYLLGINFKNFFSSGDASQYYKDAAVHATSGMSASDFYKAMVGELNKSFAREDGATKTSNPYLAFSVDNASTATKIIIEEKPQEWALGTKKARRINFDLLISTIFTGGDDVRWGVWEDTTPTTTVGNGQKVADLEWFCAGERGDQYRLVGWPNVIPTKYLANPENEYHIIEIHYAFVDTGVNSYRTEKDVTIAVPKGATDHEYDAVNAVIGAINSAAGTTLIATLS